MIEERGYFGGTRKLFDGTLNNLIEDKHLILKLEYLDAMKELSIK